MIELDSVVARHIMKRHPDFNSWDSIATVINNGNITKIGDNKITGDSAFAFVLNMGKKDMAVLASTRSGKHGNRLVIETSFQDSPKGIQHWLNELTKKSAKAKKNKE